MTKKRTRLRPKLAGLLVLSYMRNRPHFQRKKNKTWPPYGKCPPVEIDEDWDVDWDEDASDGGQNSADGNISHATGLTGQSGQNLVPEVYGMGIEEDELTE